MFKDIVINKKEIKIKYTAPPRCGTHFFEAIFKELNKNIYGYRFSDLILTHDFNNLYDHYNLITALRNPLDSIASYAAMEAINSKKELNNNEYKILIDMAIEKTYNWYAESIEFKDHFTYIFSFEELITYPKQQLSIFLNLFNIENITNNIDFDLLYQNTKNMKDNGFIHTSKNSLEFEYVSNLIKEYDLTKVYDIFNIMNNFRICNI